MSSLRATASDWASEFDKRNIRFILSNPTADGRDGVIQWFYSHADLSFEVLWFRRVCRGRVCETYVSQMVFSKIRTRSCTLLGFRKLSFSLFSFITSLPPLVYTNEAPSFLFQTLGCAKVCPRLFVISPFVALASPFAYESRIAPSRFCPSFSEVIHTHVTLSIPQSYLNPNGLKYHFEKGTCTVPRSRASFSAQGPSSTTAPNSFSMIVMHSNGIPAAPTATHVAQCLNT